MDKQPNQLDPVVALADTDVLVVQQTADNGVKQATIQQLKAAALTGDWTQLNVVPTVSTGYNKGQKEQELTYANINLSTFISTGMKVKVDRTGTTPTQCTDLENTSSQYASKTSPSGISFLDDFTVEAWIKLESYAAMTVVSRYNGTSGWELNLTSSGQPYLVAHNAAAANFSQTLAFQSVQLNQWVHVAAVLDMSTFTAAGSPIYMTGVNVPVAVNRGGTSPTALLQAGDLAVGASNATSFFDGKVSDVRVWSAIRTATQIRDNMNQQLVGNETNLVAYFKLNGNFTDSTSNGNSLTAAGSAVATNVDHPFKSTEYGYVTKVAYSAPNTVVTVFTGTDHNIPNMTLQNPYYSVERSPFGFPAGRGRWVTRQIQTTTQSQSLPTASTWYNIGQSQLSIPIGDWTLRGSAQVEQERSSSGGVNVQMGISDSTSVINDYKLAAEIVSYANTGAGGTVLVQAPITLTTQTIFYQMARTLQSSSVNALYFINSRGYAYIEAELAWA